MPETTPITEPITILVMGKHNTGRSTMASYLRLFLEEHGFKHVALQDAPALPADEKEAYVTRSAKNRERNVNIRVLTEGDGDPTYGELLTLAAYYRSCALSGFSPPEDNNEVLASLRKAQKENGR
jgi:hypothetical protein